MSDEIEDIKKRLTALEKQDLLVAKMIAETICSARYNTGILFQKGEDISSYMKFWKGKLEDTHKEIDDSKTIEGAFQILDKFDEELSAYIKATKVDTADKAMEIAHSFIKKYNPVALPLKAVREDDVWLVDIDVGALAVKIAKVKIDARTGDILSYKIPERK